MTSEELLVAVLAVAAGQGLDAWLDAMLVVLLAWTVLAVLVIGWAWQVNRG